MKGSLILAVAVTACLLAGCDDIFHNKPSLAPPGDVDSVMVNSIYNSQIDNGIIAQHTLYPYHFVADSPALNELGKRDVYVLARHFKDNPGDLNIHRGNATAEIYKARIDGVIAVLAKAGVDVKRIHIADKLPGGDGIASVEAIKIRERGYEPMMAPAGSTGAGLVGEGAGAGMGAGTSGSMSTTPQPKGY